MGRFFDPTDAKEVTAVVEISRGLCRALPALARKCVSGRPRGPAPPVAFEAKAGTLTAWVGTGDAALAYAAPTRCGDGSLVVPMAVLDAVAGAGDDPVELAVGPKLRGEARFTDRGVPTTRRFDAVVPGRQHRPPEAPADWHPAPAEFLAALHECGRTKAKEATRFALTRVQVREAAGQVIGTDGRPPWSGAGSTCRSPRTCSSQPCPCSARRNWPAGGRSGSGRHPRT